MSEARVATESVSALFGSVERRGAWEVPSHLAVHVKFGSAEPDLREAKLGPGVTTIEVAIAFGSLELTVPPDLVPNLRLVRDIRSPADSLIADSCVSAPLRGMTYTFLTVNCRRNGLFIW